MESLLALENNVQQLLEQHQQLKQQIVELQKENEHQRDEMMRTHSDLVKLKEDYNHLETAYAILAENTDGNQRERARQRLTNLIAQVDRAIDALKQ
jgi:predicted nuclease with TOPRIM domain